MDLDSTRLELARLDFDPAGLARTFRRRADEHEAPAHPERVEARAQRVRAADEIDGRVDAAARRQSEHAVGDALDARVDRRIGAVLARERELLFRDVCGEDVRARQTRHLDDVDTDATTGADHKRTI